ncbi:MAG TPA: BrnT family toxin [Rhizobiaceae bacterium]|nr:BrnT family toxin [Rhizobiaceae bacterium]
MRILWDETKRVSNLKKHGLDFADLTIEFFDDAAIYSAKNKRFLAIGFWDGIISVVFSRLGTEAISVVSMRRASQKERNLL